VRCVIGLLGQLASESQGRGDRCRRVLMLPSLDWATSRVPEELTA